jgi:hypothetical protein
MKAGLQSGDDGGAMSAGTPGAAADSLLEPAFLQETPRCMHPSSDPFTQGSFFRILLGFLNDPVVSIRFPDSDTYSAVRLVYAFESGADNSISCMQDVTAKCEWPVKRLLQLQSLHQAMQIVRM